MTVYFSSTNRVAAGLGRTEDCCMFSCGRLEPSESPKSGSTSGLE